MFFSARVPLKPLAGLCRRLATGLLAGVDLRKLLAREAKQARSAAARARLAVVSQAVERGSSLAEALAATGDFFPPLFRELVGVGEQSGHQGEIFAQLAEHYESQVRLRRSFLASITWPMVELTLALIAVGVLIWATGVIGRSTGTPIDILGLGLVGESGLAIYLALLAAVGAAIWLFVRAASRGLFWVRPIQRGLLRVPVLGPALETLALARLAWAMSLTMNAGMPLRRALRLSLQSTRNARYTDPMELIDAQIEAGNSLYDAFCEADCFPPDFLDALLAAEQSGRLVESLAHLSGQYQDQARAALATLTMLAGFAVWCLVAVMIIGLIFRVASFYLGMIKSAMP